MHDSLTDPAKTASSWSTTDHVPALDGLRALAIVGVLLTHYVPEGHWVRNIAGWGEIGVQLFFVLSGFLITGILLRCRRLIAGGQPLKTVLGRFYIRRFLRIFPLFYAAILALSIANVGYMRDTWPWHVTYLSNVALVLHDGGLGHTTHFWTLAVEEQFYLIWPLLVLTLPERMLLPAFASSVILAPVFRLAAAASGLPFFVRYALPPACLDTLAAGALLALLQTPGWEIALRRLRQLGLWIGVCGSIALIAVGTRSFAGSALHTVFFRFALAGLFVWLIDAVSGRKLERLDSVLSTSPLTYLGRISYGIYVLHHFVPEILAVGLASFGLTLAWPLLARFTLWSALAVLVASVSWFGLEKPLNDLKRYFPYGGRGPARRVDHVVLVAAQSDAR